MDREILYSRFVSWSKVLLPLLALALLSTLFLFARRPDGTSDLPMAELEEIARQPRLAHPSYAGIAADGSVIAVSAEVIRPIAAEPDSFTIDGLRATVEAPDGTGVAIAAGEAAIDGRNRLLTITGLAQIESSSGYRMETTGLVADLASGEVRTLGPLEIRAPYGRLTAGALVMRSGEDGHSLLFSGGVRLLYRPQAAE